VELEGLGNLDVLHSQGVVDLVPVGADQSLAITLTVSSKLLLLVITSLIIPVTLMSSIPLFPGTAKLNSALGALISSPGTVSMDCLEKSHYSLGSVR
jgi:hypothetical protein